MRTGDPVKILVLHGPNLNLFGRREPHIYGHTTLAQIDAQLAALAAELGVQLATMQTNHEGALVDAVQARPYVDAARTGIWGYSYGGYMTAWTIGQTDRFVAAVCGAPVFDFESFYGTSDIGHTFGPMQWGGTPHEQREWCEARSPATHAHRDGDR